ncbi:transcription termination factor Rho [Cutibacterium avidum]|uniref:transcription termination factor Rho n=1 Tax=Cutibacterium avidum TaxID=33010 RepID=UPI0002CCE145|nr:transcription termination factor Rho [Cutibacterium avidum]ERS24441.1 transcription termination factor Rho [Propionibacterium sp. KPL2005]ERS26393.1 transcription termination factor Rho [Propionibacterium sp. KPL2000]AGJ77546.1 transcription termination factor Rho [Cutibacterium avidum 44067]MCG7369443.1 transcription termination factor Rho [Cutibacterium avidum]MCO6630630.1 transcription termination factor Rho [Cutibacterium avidum]
MTQTSQPGGSSDLSTKLLPELRSIAIQMGIKGARSMRKADLVAAISDGGYPGTGKSGPRRDGGLALHTSGEGDDTRPQRTRRRRDNGSTDPESRSSEGERTPSVGDLLDAAEVQKRADKVPTQEDGGQRGEDGTNDRPHRDDGDRGGRGDSPRRRARNTSRENSNGNSGDNVNDEVGARLEALSRGKNGERPQLNRGSQRDRNNNDSNHESDDDYGRSSEYGNGGRRSRRRRQRDRQNRRKRSNERYSDSEPNVREDDVLVPCSGILDIRDQYAFVRTSGYLPGSNDAYVSMAMVRRHGLRKGDVIVGQMRAHREGERREKFAPLVKIEQVNGADPEQMKQRPEFSKLTPLYPQERLRLEDDPKNMTGRIIDLVSPIGKGQRGLIVSPPKAGKTMIMQSIANSITKNNPEVHLMVVLVDERPEEVTDFQRTVSGEVIASTFDRPADDHTQLSELAIERAKRLVELGHDVVILLDGITRLGRAYNLAAPASGRILSGGVDSAALYPPKKFFGAARNIEHGGSLTILATALVETGSKMDEVIFEEFKGTGNMELRLRREFANKRLFPAIDVDASGTRREELLLSREETAIMWKLRRVLSGLEDSQALEMMLSRLRKTQTNVEFLYTISKTTPSQD